MNRSRRLIGALAVLTTLGAACGDTDSSASKTQCATAASSGTPPEPPTPSPGMIGAFTVR